MMRQKELINVMGVDEILDWLAYDLSIDPEYKEKVMHQLSIEQQKNSTPEEEAALIANMFRSLTSAG